MRKTIVLLLALAALISCQPAMADNLVAYNPMDYGANGDGTGNDAPAIQAAINAAITAKSSVYIPQGTYNIESSISVNLGGYTGCLRISSDWAIIKATASIAECINIGNVGAAQFTMERLIVDANDLATNGVKGYKISGRRAVVQQIYEKNALDAGFVLEKCQGGSFLNCNSEYNGGKGWDIIDCNAAVFRACQAYANGGDGFHIRKLTYSGGCMLSEIMSEVNSGHGICVSDTTSPVTIRDGWLEGNVLDGVYISSVDVTMSGLGITGVGTGTNRAIRLTSTSSGVNITGCYVQRGGGDTYYAGIKVEMTKTLSDGRHYLYGNFNRYSGGIVTPVYD